MGYETSTIHVDKFLTGIAREYGIRSFIWSKLFPELQVNQLAGKIPTVGKDYFKGAPKRKPGVPAESFEGTYGDLSYLCEEHANKEILLDVDVDKADPVFKARMRRDKVFAISHRVNLAMEIRAMEIATQSSGGISSSSPDHIVTPTYTWDDTTSSTPLEDIATAIRSITVNIGVKPNVFAVPPSVEEKLAVHPEIKELIKYTSQESLTRYGLPPVILGLDVVTAPAVYNSADQGQTVSLSELWGKHAFVAHVDPNSGVNFGRMIIWTARNFRVRTWRNEEVEGTFFEASCHFVPKIITPQAAYWFDTCIA